jgi:hypothetical protein
MKMAAERSKLVDLKGRLTLGPRFAGRMVIVREESESVVTVELARVIPEREAWLYENKQALASVRRGLAQAKEGKLKPLDLEAALAVAEQCEDE